MTEYNKIALITGASSGLGLEMAKILARRGHDLVLVSRNEVKLEQLARELIRENGVVVKTFAADLSQPGSATSVFEFAEKEAWPIEILINNAGVGVFGEHSDTQLEELDAMLRLNIISLCDLCLLFGREMKKRNSGRILNISSIAAYQPTPFLAAYGASKSFVLNFSEALAKELEDHGVTVSCLSPGPTDTAFFQELDDIGNPQKHFARSNRQAADEVAAMGIDMMFKGQLSQMVGFQNQLRTFATRFAPRKVVAEISKNIMKPEH